LIVRLISHKQVIIPPIKLHALIHTFYLCS